MPEKYLARTSIDFDSEESPDTHGSAMLPLTFNLALPIHKTPFLAVPFKPSLKPPVCFAFSPSDHNPIGDEARWLREEQRWLREEQRWLREESRWNAERQALLQEINNLKLRVQELERLNSLQGASASETVAYIAKLLPVCEYAGSYF